MIDTHCHLMDPQFNKDLLKVLSRAHNRGVTKIINAGYDVETSQTAIDIYREHEWLLPAVGIHPNELAAESIPRFHSIQELVSGKTVVAIGETGLDYYREPASRSAQQELFRLHIDCARISNLPLLIHTRNSIDDAVRILREQDWHRGVFHCYSGTYEQAKTILDMGYYIGFGGILTFSKRTREVFLKLPMDRIVLETDAPFLSPARHRGQRNEPAYIFETLHVAADMLNMIPEALEKILDVNATTLFSL
jgi:TatD DNase family protein